MSEVIPIDWITFCVFITLYYYFVLRCATAAIWTRRAINETDQILELRSKKGLLTDVEIRQAFDCLLPQYKRICFNPLIRTYDQAFPWLAEWRKNRPLP